MGSKKKLIVFGVEIVVILAMLVVLFFVLRKPAEEGFTYVEIESSEVINSEYAQKQEEAQKKAEEEGKTVPTYLNIALFGVDATDTKKESLLKGSRSDCTMIASVNLETNEVKLVSVYRDTYLMLGDGTEKDERIRMARTKCNAAYSYGGATQSVKMLNMNLDLDITKFITVGYKALSEVIDDLGGVYIDVNGAELEWINGYQQGVIEALGQNSYTPITKTGYQLVNGVQAAAYCRIRYSDNDFVRTTRQREVLQSIVAQAQKASATTLVKILDHVMDDINTSFTKEEILQYLPKLTNYTIVETDGFPQEKMRTVANIGAKGSCVIPVDLESNVAWLHEFLFDENEYEVTNTVKQIGDFVKSDTQSYIDKEY